MRVPLSWLVETAPGLAGVPVADLAQRLTMAGLEVEGAEAVGAGVRGVVVARVEAFEEETASNGKTVRWCQVSTGDGPLRGVVCGARNFAVGDLVALALPGAALPGFPGEITARRTYGHVSDGMICSQRELGLGDDHAGIWVLPPDSAVGAPIDDLIRDTVLDIAVTPDRGYALSLRGIAREATTVFGLPFADPAAVPVPSYAVAGHPVRIEDPVGCDRYVARAVTAVDPRARTPFHLQRRLLLGGMRPISPSVDATNLVLLGLGQPLHAFDRDRLQGAIVVRRARDGERLTTLDGVERAVHPDDLVIADDTGPVALAGVMGGLATEVTEATTTVLLEAAHFDPVSIARTVARHGLPSEASRRFERGVDHALAPHAAEQAVLLLEELAGAHRDEASTDVDLRQPGVTVRLPLRACSAKAGRDYPPAVIRQRLTDVGCAVAGEDPLEVRPPSWRPDLTGEAELTEEVIRLEGYDTLPSELPRAAPGHGLTRSQRRRRQLGRALAAAGYVEAVVPPWMGEQVFDELALPADDDRRNATRVLNPLGDDQALLRTTLLPGLLAVLRGNVGRGIPDAGVFETGLVFRPGPAALPPAPRPSTERRPSAEELAALDAALPHQPRRVAVALSGQRVRKGWAWDSRPASWYDAVEAMQVVARSIGTTLRVSADRHAPWHPGRCAALWAGDTLVGHAGELHPGVCATVKLPARSCAAEVDLDLLFDAAGRGLPQSPVISKNPPVNRDVALVVDRSVPAAEVAGALRAGAGPWLEELRLLDRYEGEQAGPGRVSLAYRLVLRSPDRTLTDEDANAARDAAVTAAAATGAVLRT